MVQCAKRNHERLAFGLRSTSARRSVTKPWPSCISAQLRFGPGASNVRHHVFSLQRLRSVQSSTTKRSPSSDSRKGSMRTVQGIARFVWNATSCQLGRARGRSLVLSCSRVGGVFRSPAPPQHWPWSDRGRSGAQPRRHPRGPENRYGAGSGTGDRSWNPRRSYVRGVPSWPRSHPLPRSATPSRF
jgi:hypothetical protein